MPAVSEGIAPVAKRAGAGLPGRIVLGTVQLGLPYGRRHAATPPSEHEAGAILDAAWAAGIRVFDTAEAYGAAAPRLARWLRERGRLAESGVVTKVAADSAADEAEVGAACVRFEGAESLTLLSHGALEPARFGDLMLLGSARGAQVGQSVYTAAEVRAAARAGCRHMQAPANVFDTHQIEAARGAAIALDVRSVFLQGVLLDPPDIAERRAPGARVLADRVNSAARAAGLHPAAALIAAVLAQIGPDDRVIVGIDAPDQLDDVTAAFDIPRDRVREFLDLLDAPQLRAGSDPRLFDPRTWPLPA